MANFNVTDFFLRLIPPASRGFAVTPHNTNLLLHETRGVYVGVAGDLKCDLADGDTVTFVGLAGGIIHPIRATRIYATGTSATSIVGVY